MTPQCARAPTRECDSSSGPASARQRRREFWLGLLLLLVVVFRLNEAGLWRPDHWIGIDENIQVAEAQGWREGRLDLPERKWDTALKDGRIYSPFPPMFTFIAAGLIAVLGGVPHPFLVVGLALPVPVLAYLLMRRRTGSAWWALVLALGFVCGTSVWPVLRITIRGAGVYFVNHTLALIGLLIFLIEYFGRRRTWLATLGVVIAALSRQLTAAYWLPLAWMAWASAPGRARRSAIGAVAVGAGLIAGIPMTLNTLKFGHPLDSGYSYIYNDRPEDQLSRDAGAYGIFSPHFVARNLYYSCLGFPRLHRIRVHGEDIIVVRPNFNGTGIWWTTPLLLWVFVEFRRLWRAPADRVLLGAAALASAALLFYHSTGYQQAGFNRFSLDYVPALLALVTPACCVGWRRWASLAMVGWSVLYFRWLI